MTTLIAWVSYSKTGSWPDTPAALYLASDSRISWGSASSYWDAGRKIFSASRLPHVFGYYGDVLFPSLSLSQIADGLNLGLLPGAADNPHLVGDWLEKSLNISFSRRHNAPDADFGVVHGFRSGQGPDTRFHVQTIQYWAGGSSWLSTFHDVPTKTDVVVEFGSGARVSSLERKRWGESDVAGTSRAIFSAFIDAIRSGDDGLSGGPPQAAALFNAGGPVSLGYVEQEKRYLHGLEVNAGLTTRDLEWRDHLFQRIDPITLRPLQGARRFARPTNLKR